MTEAGFLAGRSAAKFAIAERKRVAQQVKLQPGDNIRYIVPHVMDKESLAESDQRLQMRVIQPIEGKVWIEVLDGEDLVTRKGQRYVRPGEMVTVDVPQKAYDAVQKTDTLTVRVVRR